MQRMYILFIFSFILSVQTSISQNNSSTNGNAFGINNFQTMSSKMRTLFEEAKMETSTLDEIIKKKNEFLFDEWADEAIIIIENRRYVFPNVNYNINRDIFITRINKDSTYVLNSGIFNKVILKGKVFKSFYDSKKSDEKIYEVIYENEKTSILKEYYLSVMERSTDIMMDRGKDDIRKKSKYLLLNKDNSNFSQFKLRKKYIIELINEKNRSEIDVFVKEKKLSYKNEEDLKKIFRFNSLL